MHPGEATIKRIEREPVRARHEAAPAPLAPIAFETAPFCQFFAPDALSDDLKLQWSALGSALAGDAAEPNVFAERWFLESSLERLAVQEDVRLAVVTLASGELVGLMPLTVKSEYGRIPIRNVQNWQHANAFLGLPLVRAGMETAFWQALLTALDECSWATGLAHFTGLTEDGPVFAGLQAVGRRCDIAQRYERALLQSDRAPEDYWAGSVRSKKRKELRRQAKRLAEKGELGFRTLGEGDDAAEWARLFLELETRGWKGDAGSALGCEGKHAGFFIDICERAHREAKLDFHRLDLNGRPIAMLVNFLSPPGGFSFKIAFDENYARFSPGVLIEEYNLRVLDRDDIGWMDSCASVDHPMINSLWRERRTIILATLPLSGLRNAMIFRACRSAENAAAAVKRLVNRFRAKRDG